MTPVGVEDVDDLLDVVRIVGDDPVVASQGEVLDHQVVGGHHGGFAVDDDRLLVCDVELGVGPLNVQPGVHEFLVGVVVGAVAAGAFGVEHHPHVHSGLEPIEGGLHEAGLGESELFDQQGALGAFDEGAHRLQTIIRLDN